MEKSKIVPVEEWQDIVSRIFKEDLTFDPRDICNWYVNNVVQRTLAHLVGQAGTGAKVLQCTEGGELKVASTGAGFEHNETIARFTVGDAYSADQAFSQVVSRCDITVWTKGVIVKRRLAADLAYEDPIEIPADTFISVDASTQAWQIKNAVAGQNADIQIVGWR